MVNEEKKELKEFCQLCGKNVDELISTPTIEVGEHTLMIDMCAKCAITTHNLLRVMNEEIRRLKTAAQKLIIPPRGVGGRLS